MRPLSSVFCRPLAGSARLICSQVSAQIVWCNIGCRGLHAHGRRILTADVINAALAAPDPYAALGYHPADADGPDPISRIRSGAHGTHVLDIAGGSDRGDGMSGVAPNADLVFVHLARMTDVLGRGNLGDSASLLEALDYVFAIAGDRPCV